MRVKATLLAFLILSILHRLHFQTLQSKGQCGTEKSDSPTGGTDIPAGSKYDDGLYP